ERALAAARGGQGGLVIVSGEAGVGKSRLITELRERAVGRNGGQVGGPAWLDGRCQDVGRTESYGPFVDLLRMYFAFQPADDEQTRGARLATGLKVLAEQGTLPAERCAEMLPVLGALLSARLDAGQDAWLAAIGPEQLKQQTFMALYDLF